MIMMSYVFIAIGLIVGFLQYGLLKTIITYMTEKKGAAGVVAIKLALYGLLAAVLILWFDTMWVYCLAGVGTGILLTACLDFFRSKSK